MQHRFVDETANKRLAAVSQRFFPGVVYVQQPKLSVLNFPEEMPLITTLSDAWTVFTA